MSYNELILPLEIYSEHLTIIGNVKTSQREIDILACILSGRSAKGTAHFLSISPKTVETHTYNVMKKLECVSREDMISLIENSAKFLILKKYYLSLLPYIAFEQNLKRISKIIENEIIVCNIISYAEQEGNYSLLYQLKNHLNSAGIKTLLEVRKTQESFMHLIQEPQGTAYTIYVIPKEKINNKIDKISASKNFSFIFFEKENGGRVYFHIDEFGHKKFSKKLNYYSFAFDILKKILPQHTFNHLITDFTNKYELPNVLQETILQKEQEVTLSTSSPIEIHALQKVKRYNWLTFITKKKMPFFLGSIGCLSGFCFWFFILTDNTHNDLTQYNKLQMESSIRSDLMIPNESLLLDRPYLLKKMEQYLTGQQGIQTAVLLGEGGSGKTTLVRQYARLQRVPLVWEINAETKDSLIASFEDLAFALSQAQGDKNIWRELKKNTIF